MAPSLAYGGSLRAHDVTAKVISPPPTARRVVVEMDEDSAHVLRAFVGRTSPAERKDKIVDDYGRRNYPRAVAAIERDVFVLDGVYTALDAALGDRR